MMGNGERVGSPRVRVEFRQLKQWYRTLDQLHARKEQIEKELFLRLRDLFSLEVDMVFYDLTSTYFEGQGPPGLGAHGYSRDRRPRNRQVLIGLVMVDGWPIAHHVFAGNWRDAKTVPQVLNDLNERFGLPPRGFCRRPRNGNERQPGSGALAQAGLSRRAAKTTARGGLSLHRARQRRVDRLPLVASR